MARAKRDPYEELQNQKEFVTAVLALVQKHFGRKRKANGKAKFKPGQVVPLEEYERA